MADVEMVELFESFIRFIEPIGRPEQTQPVIKKVRELIDRGQLPPDVETAERLLIAYEQEALQIKLDKATLIAAFGSE